MLLVLGVTTPNGSVMCTGDFRFDYNPIGEIYTDFTKLDAIGKEGLTVLLSDSTNAMRPSHSPKWKRHPNRHRTSYAFSNKENNSYCFCI